MRENLLGLLSSIGINIDERWQWATELFVVVTIVLVINLAVRVVLGYMERGAKHSKNVWDDALINAAGAPIRLAVWIIGLVVAGRLAAQQSEAAQILEWLSTSRGVGLTLCFAWFLIRLIREIEQAVWERNRHKTGDDAMDKHSMEAISKLVRAAVMITTVLVVLQTLGFSVSGVLAFGGIGGIAVGFAAKDILANFFGGLFIYLDKPFVVGDWIKSPDQDIEGTVENIGWRRTVVRRFDKRPLYVPNGTFNNISVENPSRMTNRRIYETIGVRYCDHEAVTLIVDEIRSYLENHEEIDSGQTLIVNFNAFNDCSLDFFIYTFTKTTAWVEYHKVKHAILLDVYEIIRKRGGDMAFPTTTLDIPQPLVTQGQ
jgi:MscS family membrane protein